MCVAGADFAPSRPPKPYLPLSNGSSHAKSSQAALTLLALGVVMGDIGTSPLYAVKQLFAPGHGIPVDPPNILGGFSAIFWALMIVVSIKYVVLIMRADNKGEGGIMALIALATNAVRDQPGWRAPLLLIGVFGASLSPSSDTSPSTASPRRKSMKCWTP